MQLRQLAITLTLGTVTLSSQGPMNDTVIVNLPYPVTIRGTTLEPGEYTIRQMSGPANNRVLHIFKDGGMKLETSVMTIAALENKTPEDTKVVLHHIGKDYYFDKIWIQGKDYGYEFVLPDDIKSRMREAAQPYTVVARYEAQPPPAVAPDTAAADAAAAREREAQAERDRLAQADRDREAQAERDRLAQVERDRAAQADRDREAQAERDRLAQAERDRAAQEDRDRLAQSQTTTPQMPETAANWLMLLAGGVTLSGLGATLLRRS